MDLVKKIARERARENEKNQRTMNTREKYVRRQESLCFMGIEQRTDTYTADENLISPLLSSQWRCQQLNLWCILLAAAAAVLPSNVDICRKRVNFTANKKLIFNFLQVKYRFDSEFISSRNSHASVCVVLFFHFCFFFLFAHSGSFK